LISAPSYVNEAVRKGIAEKMENYTCLDSALNTTEDVHKTTWTHRGTKRVVHVKHDRPASRIHVVEKFIDDEECLAMEKAAEKSLHRATVADGKGGSRLSEHRKALQAGIVVPWGKEADGDPIARLSRRVYDYANHVLGLGIEEHGQEDLMSIQVRPSIAFSSARLFAVFRWRERSPSSPNVPSPFSSATGGAVRGPREGRHRPGSLHTALRRRLHRPLAQERAEDGHDGHVLRRPRGGRYVKSGRAAPLMLPGRPPICRSAPW
jgi:hypothetical protein